MEPSTKILMPKAGGVYRSPRCQTREFAIGGLAALGTLSGATDQNLVSGFKHKRRQA
jgi:hypothetical protein